jgi:hypothetical protein
LVATASRCGFAETSLGVVLEGPEQLLLVEDEIGERIDVGHGLSPFMV